MWHSTMAAKRPDDCPMNPSIAATCIALLTCAIVLPSVRAAPPADSPPWISLFNGRDLLGWKLVGDKGRGEVRDGAIICRQTPQTREHTFVCSEQRYADFILELECRSIRIITEDPGRYARPIDLPLTTVP
jgi:hypothetical protein